VLVIANVVQMVLIGAVPALAVLNMLALWQLYVVVFLAGIASLFEAVASQSFTPSLVPREELLSANSVLMASNGTVSSVGSAVGSALVAVLAAPVAMIVDAVSFLFSGLCVARIGTPGPEPVSRPNRHLLRDIGEGLRAIVAQPLIRVVITTAALGAFAGQMQNVMLVYYIVRNLHLSAALAGVAITIVGVTGVLTTFVTTRITRRIGPGPAFIFGMMTSAVSGVVLAVAGGPFIRVLVILVLAMVLRGAGPSLYGINQQTLRQTLITPSLLSRVNATWRFLVYGTQALGALVGGLLGAVDLRVTLVIGSVIMLIAGVMAFASPLRSLRQLPAPQTAANS
jgi:MFS family permease